MKYLLIIFLLSTQLVYSSSLSNPMISMDLQDVNMPDAIRLFAQFNQANVVISPTIHGSVTLHLHHVSANKAFDLLLGSYGLSKWKMDNVWYVMSSAELIQREQEQIKLQSLIQETSPLLTQIW